MDAGLIAVAPAAEEAWSRAELQAHHWFCMACIDVTGPGREFPETHF